MESNRQLNSMQKVRKKRMSETKERREKLNVLLSNGVTDIDLLSAKLGVKPSTVKKYLKS